jgi:hypothetical protein
MDDPGPGGPGEAAHPQDETRLLRRLAKALGPERA